MAVKPDIIPFVLEEINPYRPRRVISVAAAVTAATLEAGLPEKTPVIRVMPNTPASVGEGMTAITAGRYADEDFIETAKKYFPPWGKRQWFPNASLTRWALYQERDRDTFS